MKVADLAKDLNTDVNTILQTLKLFKLKAKDGDQDLSVAVVSVVRSELVKSKKIAAMQLSSKEGEAKSPKTIKNDVKIQKAKPRVEKDVSKVKTSKKIAKNVIPLEELSAAAGSSSIPTSLVPPPTTLAPPLPESILSAPLIPVAKPVFKSRMVISSEPVFTLKPLARKKRRVDMRGDSSSGTAAHPVFDQTGNVLSESSSFNATSSTDKGVSLNPLVDLEIQLPITVKDFSSKVQQKPSIVLKSLMQIGILAHINQSLDGEIVNKLAKDFGYNIVKIKTQEEQLVETNRKADDDPHLLKFRAPVITFMGHVDHGKTSLLDSIRKSKVTDTEHGGITQHIGAYSVELPKGRITFLDTPGHEAFTAMRARGAHITDIIVLVVAADEGVMPQTDEAIDHARAANVPIVVALNKIDRKNADPDRVKKQLAERGLNSEDWGGKTIVKGVSALTGEGVDQLLELILLEAELLELKANPEKKASGIVVDAHLSPGKGAVTTLIVQSGTLRDSDIVVVGSCYGRVRAMTDDRKRTIKEAGPSMPVEILGLSDVPEAGELFYIVDDEHQAREITLKRKEERKNKRLHATSRITLEDLYIQVQEGQIKELNVIIKADVQGSLEALKDSLGKIPSDRVKIKFIHLGVGGVNASDVILAVASHAIIIAFHVVVDQRAKEELEKQPVDVRQYRIIYDAVNDIRNALEGLLEAKTRKKFLGRVEIRQVFKLSKHGIIAGSYVLKGKVTRKDHVDIVRNGTLIYTGTVSTLKRFKDDVREVTEGMECGVSFAGFDQFLSGDMVESYDIEKITQKL